QHGTQTPGDLNTRTAEVTNFGDGQADVILPVRGAVHEAKPARAVTYLSIVQTPIAHLAEKAMDLIQGEDCRGRVVNRRRKRFGGDVHHEAERISRVLLESAFLTDGHRLAQRLRRECRAALKKAEKGVSGGQVIANLGDQFNDTVRTLGQGQKSL